MKRKLEVKKISIGCLFKTPHICLTNGGSIQPGRGSNQNQRTAVCVCVCVGVCGWVCMWGCVCVCVCEWTVCVIQNGFGRFSGTDLFVG